MNLNFTKMQALGNDFVLIDSRKKRLKNISRLSKALCDRRFGIGADQMLLLNESTKADFKMRIFNADGSEVEMCGNGIRCFAKYIWDNKLMVRQAHHPEQSRGKNHGSAGLPTGQAGSLLEIETLAGIIRPQKSGNNIKVDMGEPVLEPRKIPVRINTEVTKLRSSEAKKSQPLNLSTSQLPGSLRSVNFVPIVNYPIVIGGMTFKITCVSMGNPHAVIVVNDVKKVPLEKYGPVIEKHRLFPKRTNVEFIQVEDSKKIKMRVWERGAGETMACGTGASAAVVASSLLGLTGRKAAVYLPGGRLLIEWSAKNGHVYMTGPATTVFEGSIEIK